MEPNTRLYLAIDQGGHASRATLYNSSGMLLNRVSVPVHTQYPAPEFIEHDPEEMAASVHTALGEVLRSAGSAPLISAGLATQRSSVVCWDKISGAALSPVLSWQDRRTAGWLMRLQGRSTEILRRTGLPLSPHYGAGKLRWCLDHLPAVQTARREGRLACGPLASFLVYRLTREHTLGADPANASRTLLWGLDNGDWDPELTDIFAIPSDTLPPCLPTRAIWGHINTRARDIPLDIVTGDQSAALFAAGEPTSGSVMINLGTGAFLQQALLTRPPQSRLLAGIAYQDRAKRIYSLEGTINGAGSALTWIAAQIGLEESEIIRRLPGWLDEVDNPPLFLNGVSGLGTPYLAPLFAPCFSSDGSPPEKCVGVIESIVFLLCVNLEEMSRARKPAAHLVIGGGLSRLDGLCRRLANLSGLAVSRLDDHEASARGLMRLLAGADPATFDQPEETNFLPQADPILSARYRNWREALDDALAKLG